MLHQHPCSKEIERFMLRQRSNFPPGCCNRTGYGAQTDATSGLGERVLLSVVRSEFGNFISSHLLLSFIHGSFSFDLEGVRSYAPGGNLLVISRRRHAEPIQMGDLDPVDTGGLVYLARAKHKDFLSRDLPCYGGNYKNQWKIPSLAWGQRVLSTPLGNLREILPFSLLSL